MADIETESNFVLTDSVTSGDVTSSSSSIHESEPPTLPEFPVSYSPGPVGGRLGQFWQNWAVIGADDWVINILRGGYFLPFTDILPPVTSTPPDMSYSSSHPLFQELSNQVQILLDKQAIEIVTDSSPGFFSRLFLAPKKSGDWRPVIDLSCLNKFISTPKFKMETIKSILEASRPGAWCTSLDFQDAFLHIPIALRHRKYLRFSVQGQVFQFRTLPFGLTTSPCVFTRVVKAVGAFVHSHGLHMIQYLDDWNISSDSYRVCLQWTLWLLELVKRLGLLVNFKKSDLEPAQIYQFVGILFDLLLGSARPADHRIEKFTLLVAQFLKFPAPRAEQWQVILGHMTSLERLVPRGRLHMRPLQFQLGRHWSQHVDAPSSPVPLNVESRQALDWWRSPEHLRQGVPLRTQLPQVTLFTDASTDGWGAHIDNHLVRGTWSAAEQKLHINNLELKAVMLALLHFQVLVSHTRVLVMTDNTTVVGQIKNQGGTHSLELFELTRELFTWTDSHQVTLIARHIPGHLNVIADRLSRHHQVIHTEWSLALPVLDRVWKLWGQPHVDMFATCENFKLPTYVSPLPDVRAWRTDALSFSWINLWMYMYPPVPLLQEVLEHISLVPCEVILIAPAWPSQTWYTRLLELCTDHPRRLPVSRTLLKQPSSQVFHANPAVLHLHAWRLSGPLSRAKVSQRTWLEESPQLTGTVRRPFTTVAGASSVLGVMNRGTIHSLCLPQ